MALVHVDKLEVDMVLSEDVKDIKSRLLLAKGQKIQSKHIRIFKIWGITEVSVTCGHDEERQLESNIDPNKLEEIEEETKHMFKHVDLSHPALKELFRISILYKSQKDINTDGKITLTGGDDLRDHSIYNV